MFNNLLKTLISLRGTTKPAKSNASTDVWLVNSSVTCVTRGQLPSFWRRTNSPVGTKWSMYVFLKSVPNKVLRAQRRSTSHPISIQLDNSKGDQSKNNHQSQQKGSCYHCDKNMVHSQRDFPAKEATCSHCKKKGHYDKICCGNYQDNSSTQHSDKKFGKTTVINKVGSNSPATSVNIFHPLTNKFLG